jgi:hypothetical protein
MNHRVDHAPLDGVVELPNGAAKRVSRSGGAGRARGAARWRTLSTLIAAGAVVAGSACGAAPTDPASPTSALRASELHLKRHTWGGMCEDGACQSDLVISPDGHWTFDTQAGRQREGRLSDGEMLALQDAAERSGLADASAAPSTRCDADIDGESVAYTWTIGGTKQDVSSCTTRFDANDPLVQAMERLADRVTS